MLVGASRAEALLLVGHRGRGAVSSEVLSSVGLSCVPGRGQPARFRHFPAHPHLAVGAST